jgi:predicted SAM-dependent methyltransferase
LRLFKAPTLYWLRIELTVAFHRLVNLLSLRRPDRIKKEAVYLNVGCGPKGLRSPSWFNLDATRMDGVDLPWDAGRSLPFRRRRFRGIFTEHFLEHLPEDEARVFLGECLRVLEPGGTLRISVPDGGLYLEKHHSDPSWLLERWGGRFQTPMEVINRVFRQGSEHQYCYDFETLALRLREVGFEEVRRADFGQGADPELWIDQPERRLESLYVEAKRPRGEPLQSPETTQAGSR